MGILSILILQGPDHGHLSISLYHVQIPSSGFYSFQNIGLSSPSVQFSSVQFTSSVMSNSLRHHESQHARPPCPPSSSPELNLFSTFILCDVILNGIDNSFLLYRISKYQNVLHLVSFNFAKFIYRF